jgi:HK97 family phage major capsid protein
MLLEAIRQHKAPPVDVGSPTPDQSRGTAPYGVASREMLHGGMSIRAFKGTGALLGGRMADQEVAYRAGKWAQAVIHGNAEALRWCVDAGVQMAKGTGEHVTRAMTEGIFTSAGWLIPSEMESSIIANREQYGVARRLCQIVPMSTSSTQIPRITADQTAYFVGEGTAGTETDSAGDQVTLTLKDLMAYSRIGKSTAQDSAIPLAEMVANEQSRAFAIKEDACTFIGDGTSTYGGIMGIVTLLELAAYAGGRYANASPVNTFAEVTNTEISGLIGKLPVYARQGARFVCSGVAEALVFSRLRLAAGGNDSGTLNGGVLEFPYAGFPISVAHNMPAGASTDYASKIMILLGNFQLGVAFGTGNGMMMTVDPYSQAEQNLTRIITSERIDIVAHGVNKSTTVAGCITGMYGTT